MNSIDVKSWEEFEKESRRLVEERGKSEFKSEILLQHLLFRGQSDANWDLETTLERFSGNRIPVSGYYELIEKIRPEIETLTGRKWHIKSVPEYRKWLEAGNDFFNEFPGYDYMVYLRHHGFPSPLLDWTRSPYVAALFAFSDFSVNADMVTIFVYQESTKGSKGYIRSFPHIYCRGQNVTSDKRHFLQKSEYTICCATEKDEWFYRSHEETFAAGSEGQDLLWKFNIPITEREKVLKRLDEYNLNRFSLFGSEESLLSTIATRELFLRTIPSGRGYWRGC
jgi:hypothetical protein